MNRYSKGLVQYPTEDKGGGSHSSLPQFTNILGQTISNMTALKNFNEKSVADMVSNQEAVTKLQAGLFDKIEGMNLYLGAYEEDKKYVNSVTSAYVEKLKEIAANPQDPFAKMKVAQLGFEMTQDLTAGNLGKIAENAKVHMARLQDLEQNKGVLSVDPNAKNDYDDDNKDFKGTIKTDKNGNITHHSLKYVPISAPLDHQKGLKEHMDNRKDSSLPVAEPFRVVTLEGDPNRTHVLNTTMIGVDEATAYNDAKGYFDKVSSSGEDRRRLVKEFEKKAKEGPDGKYFETKDKEGNPIKLSLDEFIDARNTERALQNYGQFVHKKVSQSLGQTDDPELRRLTAQHKENALYLQGLNAQRTHQAMSIAARNAQIREEAHQLRMQAKKESEGKGEPFFNVDNFRGEGFFNQDDLTDINGLKGVTKDKIKALSASNNQEYKRAADLYDNTIEKNLTEIAGDVINDTTLLTNLAKQDRKKFVEEYLLQNSSAEFRNASDVGKAKILRDALTARGVKLPPIQNNKGTLRFPGAGDLGTSDPISGWVSQLDKNRKFKYNGKGLSGPELYQVKLGEVLNTASSYAQYMPNASNTAFNTKTTVPLATKMYSKLGNTTGMLKDDFVKAFQDGTVYFGDDNEIVVKIKQNVKIDKDTNEVQEKVYKIKDAELYREYGSQFGIKGYEMSFKNNPTGDAIHLLPVAKKLIGNDKDKLAAYERFVKGKQTQFVINGLDISDVRDNVGLQFHLQGLNQDDEKEIMQQLKREGAVNEKGQLIQPFFFINKHNDKGELGSINVVVYKEPQYKVNALNELITLHKSK